MLTGKLYRHKNNTDVAFMPQDIVIRPDNLFHIIHGDWYNIVNPDNVWFINSDRIRVKVGDLSSWKEYWR